MAENTVDIPVNLSFEQARAELRAFLEEAGRGVSVPVRGGVNPAGGGQYAAAPITVADAETAAVSRAMNQARTDYRGGYAPVFGGGGGGLSGGGSFRVDTNDAEIALRRVQGIFDALRQQFERGLILRVDTSAAQAGMRVGAAPTAISGETRIPITGATTPAEWDAMAGTLPAGEAPGPFEETARVAQRYNVRSGRRSIAGSPRAYYDYDDPNEYGPSRADRRRYAEAYAPALREQAAFESDPTNILGPNARDAARLQQQYMAENTLGPTREDARRLAQAAAPRMREQARFAADPANQQGPGRDLYEQHLAANTFGPTRDDARRMAQAYAPRMREQAAFAADPANQYGPGRELYDQYLAENTYGPTREDASRLQQAAAPRLQREALATREAERARAVAQREAQEEFNNVTRFDPRLPRGIGRGLISILGVTEVNRNLRAVTSEGIGLMTATDAAGSAQATIQGIEQQTSGLLGSVVGLGADVIMGNRGPSGTREQLALALAQSQSLDRTRQTYAEIAVSQNVRAADGGFNRSVATIEGQRDLQIRALTQRQSDLKAAMGAQPPWAGGVPAGAIPLSGYQPGQSQVPTEQYNAWKAAQAARQREIDAIEAQKGEITATAGQQIQDAKTGGIYLARLESDRIASGYQRQAAGMSNRELARSSLRDLYASRAVEDTEKFGGPEGFARNRREYHAADAAQEEQFRREDFSLQTGLAGTAAVAALGAANMPVQARIASIRAQAQQQGIAALNAGGAGMNANLAAIAAAEQAQVREVQAAAGRGYQAQAIALGGSATQLGALLGRDPLGAQIAGIQTQRDLALANLPKDAPKELAAGIRGNAELQEQLVTRQFAERREDIGDRFAAEIRESRDRQRGGSGVLDARIDRIVSTTSIESRDLRRQGEERLAQQRRQLGREQLDELRTDFYRSVHFEEVADPTGIATTQSRRGAFGNIEAQFRAGQAAIDKAAKDGTGAGGNQVPPMLQTIIGLIQQFATKNFTAKAH